MSEDDMKEIPMEDESEEMEGGKKTSWMKLVMKVKRANPKLSLGQAMKKAKSMYKKTRRGGGAPLTPALVGGSALSPATVGGRRRGSRRGTKKTRRNRKH